MAKHIAHKGLWRCKADDSRRSKIANSTAMKTRGLQVVGCRFERSCSNRDSLALRTVSIGLRMRESPCSAGMREKMSRSSRKSNGAADRMRASGKGSTA
ncbi:hypothetical protein [Caballeronia sp. INDeC2]|uniref:hypothetical protein n=1 Tax=Caballeronia sp. INDeC2 TaxID=2921747 RepID=UPI002028BFF3|nr:hypothetical protein [Caballeronia sp. INDeC2]